MDHFTNDPLKHYRMRANENQLNSIKKNNKKRLIKFKYFKTKLPTKISKMINFIKTKLGLKRCRLKANKSQFKLRI